MALELCGYNYHEKDWVMNNLDVKDFVIKKNYKKFIEYCNYLANSNDEVEEKSKKDLELE